MNVATKKTKTKPHKYWKERPKKGTGIVRRQFKPGKNGSVWAGFYQAEKKRRDE